jgi:hypothetical protein
LLAIVCQQDAGVPFIVRLSFVAKQSSVTDLQQQLLIKTDFAGKGKRKAF